MTLLSILRMLIHLPLMTAYLERGFSLQQETVNIIASDSVSRFQFTNLRYLNFGNSEGAHFLAGSSTVVVAHLTKSLVCTSTASISTWRSFMITATLRFSKFT